DVAGEIGDVGAGVVGLTVTIGRRERPAFAVHMKTGIDAIGEIGAEVGARLEPARRPIVQVRRDDDAVDILLELFRPDEPRRAGAVAEQRVRETGDETVIAIARTAEALRANAHGVVR